MNDSTLSYTENQAATAINTALTVADSDNTTLSSASKGEFSGGSSATNNMGTACGGGDCQPRTASLPPGRSAASEAYNHRCWHPVVFPTGRDRGERGMAATGRINLLPPFKDTIGLNKMQLE